MTDKNEGLKACICEDCGTELNMNGCLVCGAPVCCPRCCQVNSFEMEIAALQARLNIATGMLNDVIFGWKNGGGPTLGELEDAYAKATKRPKENL